MGFITAFNVYSLPRTTQEMKEYVNNCSQEIENICVTTGESVSRNLREYDPILYTAICGSALAVKGIYDLSLLGWRSKRAWVEIGVGTTVIVTSLFASRSKISDFFLDTFSKVPVNSLHPVFCKFPLIDKTNAELVIKNYLEGERMSGTVTCDKGRWDLQQESYHQICEVSPSEENCDHAPLSLAYYPLSNKQGGYGLVTAVFPACD